MTSAPHGEHVEDDGEDSDDFLVLLWLVQFVNLQVSLPARNELKLRLSPVVNLPYGQCISKDIKVFHTCDNPLWFATFGGYLTSLEGVELDERRFNGVPNSCYSSPLVT